MDKADKPAPGAPTTALLASMLDCVGSPVFAKDRRHRFVYLNKAAEGFLGRPGAEMLGKTDTDFFPEDQVRVFWERDDEVFRTGRENVNEEHLTDAVGRRHVIVTRKQLLRTPDGGETLVGIINDITELRKANNELTVFRKLLENSNDAIFIVDPANGSFLDVNETACRRLGYPRATLLRMGVPDIEATLQAPGAWSELLRKAQGAGNLLLEGRHLRADGSAFPVEVSVSSTTVDEKVYILASARDITERKRMEEAMNEVDTLRGLIPICAKCKKIRNDKGFWEKIEAYMEKHSKARFTHGLCKDCMGELYGKESWFKDGEK